MRTPVHVEEDESAFEVEEWSFLTTPLTPEYGISKRLGLIFAFAAAPYFAFIVIKPYNVLSSCLRNALACVSLLCICQARCPIPFTSQVHTIQAVLTSSLTWLMCPDIGFTHGSDSLSHTTSIA